VSPRLVYSITKPFYKFTLDNEPVFEVPVY
jgi:hypothetical protein